MSNKTSPIPFQWPPIPFAAPENAPLLHDLKTWPMYFGSIESGSKTFEIRRSDRTFSIGDYLKLSEYNPHDEVYTGRFIFRRIVYMLLGVEAEFFGLKPGFCVLGLAPVTRRLVLLEGGGYQEQFTAGDLCPVCAKPLVFGKGYDANRDEPGQAPAVYCRFCLLDYPVDWERLSQD